MKTVKRHELKGRLVDVYNQTLSGETIYEGRAEIVSAPTSCGGTLRAKVKFSEYDGAKPVMRNFSVTQLIGGAA